MATKRAVVLYGGGLDSFTLLHYVLRMGMEAHALSFYYGQRNCKELQYAERVCAKLGVDHRIADLRALYKSLGPDFMSSALTKREIPIAKGAYGIEGTKRMTVPNRNSLFIAVAVAWAIPLEAEAVYYGANQGGRHVAPDCRPPFVAHMRDAIKAGNYDAPDLRAPFLHMDKGDVLLYGLNQLGLSLEDYADTWSCFDDGRLPCGECGACSGRAEAFAKAGLEDPLLAHGVT